MTIAVFVNGRQRPCTPHEADRVAVFRKHNGQWTESESRRVMNTGIASPQPLAGFQRSLAALTGGAQAVAGAAIAGLAFTALNQLGKHIFEITDITPEALSGIAEDIATATAQQALAEDAFRAARPAETEIKDVYTLDLVTALEAYPELSSKMILKPFLRSTPFSELTLICRHIPHWLETEREITVRRKRRGEYLVLTIQKQCCGEAVL